MHEQLKTLLELRTHDEEQAQASWAASERRCRGLEEQLAEQDSVVSSSRQRLEAFLDQLDQRRATTFSIREVRHQLEGRDSLNQVLKTAEERRAEIQLKLREARAEASRRENAYRRACATRTAVEEELESILARLNKKQRQAAEEEMDDLVAHLRHARNKTRQGEG